MLKLVVLLAATLAAASASSSEPKREFTDLVTFGDSYTDEGRLAWFEAHNGTAPPPGTYFPPINTTTDGSYIWARTVADITGVTLHDYAVSGAVCSQLLTPRYSAAIPGLFPSVTEYEIPAFLADFQRNDTLNLNVETTMFSLWIGTNDLKNGALLTDEQTPGVSITNVTDCAVNAITRLYDEGARYFIFQNAVPLFLAPLYATAERNGVTGVNHYFPTKDNFLNGNLTAISDRMREEVLATNQIWKYQLPAVAATLKDAKIAIFDSHALFLDIIYNPEQYLTAPFNTTGYIYHCNTTNNCATSYIADDRRNGYVWYDELHPSQRTDAIVAEEFSKAMQKESKWATYLY